VPLKHWRLNLTKTIVFLLLLSQRKYKEEYMADKDLIYYPVHLTPGYEAALKSTENRSDVSEMFEN